MPKLEAIFIGGIFALLATCYAPAQADMPAHFKNFNLVKALLPAEFSPFAEEPDSLSELLKKISGVPAADRSRCDDHFAAIKAEIVNELTRRAPEIAAYANRKPAPSLTNADEVMIPLGPITLRAQKHLAPPRRGMVSEPYGWQEVVEFYKNIVRRPVDERWVRLNTGVQSLLIDDANRVLEGSTSWASLNDVRFVWAFYIKLGALENSLNLEKASLTPSEIRKIKGQKVWNEVRHYSVAQFRDYLHLYLQVYQFNKNADVTRVDATTIVADLNPGPFMGVKEKLAALIETKWSSPYLKVKINWVTSEKAFRFKVRPGVQQRDYVDYEDRSINLYDQATPGIFAHEFGHVLGFPDHYFSAWNDKKCTYESESFEEDLMSDQDLGQVTEAEWRTLDQIYLWPPRQATKGEEKLLISLPE